LNSRASPGTNEIATVHVFPGWLANNRSIIFRTEMTGDHPLYWLLVIVFAFWHIFSDGNCDRQLRVQGEDRTSACGRAYLRGNCGVRYIVISGASGSGGICKNRKIGGRWCCPKVQVPLLANILCLWTITHAPFRMDVELNKLKSFHPHL
jgi:hypothetical protein